MIGGIYDKLQCTSDLIYQPASPPPHHNHQQQPPTKKMPRPEPNNPSEKTSQPELDNSSTPIETQNGFIEHNHTETAQSSSTENIEQTNNHPSPHQNQLSDDLPPSPWDPNSHAHPSSSCISLPPLPPFNPNLIPSKPPHPLSPLVP